VLAQVFDDRRLPLEDVDPAIDRRAARRISEGELQPSRRFEAREILDDHRILGELQGPPRCLRISLASGVNGIVARRQVDRIVSGGVGQGPGVGLAISFDHHQGCLHRAAARRRDTSRQTSGGQVLAGDLGGDHARQVAAAHDLQPALEGAAPSGRQGMTKIKVPLAIAEPVEARLMQGDDPVPVIGDDPVAEGAGGRPLGLVRQSRDAEKISALRP
jgi:hypothetical protein